MKPERVLLAISPGPWREVLAATLTVAGYDIQVAGNGAEALGWLNMATPDLVVLQSQLPGMDGYQVCARLRQNRPNGRVPVIILANYGELNSQQRALEVGADACLPSAEAPGEVLTWVRFLLGSQHRSEGLVEAEGVFYTLAAAVEAKDPWNQGHLERVVDYALRLGKTLGLDATQWRELRWGAILHDVGKVVVPDSILTRAGPLSEAEWQDMKLHPVIGERICQPLGLGRGAMDVVRYHHERFDGRGYPDGLAGRDIPLAGRIGALADAFDALTSDRPYRRRFTLQEALDILREEAGGQFDPQLVAWFIPLVEK